MIDDFALVLRANPSQELSFRLGDAELLEGVLNVLGDFFPRLALLLGWTDVVEDVVEIDPGEIRAPVRHRALLEVLQCLQPKIAHPIGLVLHRRDLFDGGAGQPSPALENVVFLVPEAVLIFAYVNLWLGDHGLLLPRSDAMPGRR